MKRERIELLRKKGIQFHGVSIGDPEDKPHKDFFQKGIMLARKELGYHLDLSNAIMAGDSYTADLEVPKNMFGFGLVVLFSGCAMPPVAGFVFLGVGIIYETIFSDARQLLLFITHCVLIAFVEFACAVGLPQENVSLFSFI